jgi:hypothetical protein
MKLSIRIVLLTGAFACALSARPIAALEIRHADTVSGVFSAGLVRAYEPCTAPNVVSADGTPACQPAVTSACVFESARLTLGRLELVRPETPTDPAFCTTGTYVLHVTSRVTVDRDPNEPLCAGAVCTLPDETATTVFTYAPGEDVFVNSAVTFFFNSNREWVSATLYGPDGLPMAALGAGGFTGSVGVTYPRCTSPDPGHPGCTNPPWRPACDFNAGLLEWKGTSNPGAHVRLSPVAGITPLCKTGTYSLQADVRATLRNCNGEPGSPSCTLVDTSVAMPLTANGTDLDTASGFGAGGLPGALTAELLDARIVDPTGAALASIGSPVVGILGEPRTTITATTLKIQTLYPRLDAILDPTEPPGVTFLLTTHGDAILDGTIPPERWQLQLPFGERWSYRDPGGVIAGIRSATIKLKRKKGAPIGYEVRVLATDLPPVADAASVNLAVTIPLEPDPALVATYQAQRNRICKMRLNKIDCR